MKYCVSCGAQMADTAAYCPACGEQVKTVAAEAVPVEAPPAKPRRNVKDLIFSIVAVASGSEAIVMAVIASIYSFFPFVGIFSGLLAPVPGIVGLIFSKPVREPQNVRRAKVGRVMSLVSVIVSAVSLLVAIVWTVLFFGSIIPGL